ncbi:Mediator of RNA polymerase II transcription subunit 14 [Lamellibrachia satsuma]|nr:Mediator of RNA polymerase II transcription subunit 14 [Lamellibrachia satsuma]
MPREKWQTLKRLNQIIEHRLVTSDLPKHMRRPQIQNGRVSFQVEHEFEVTLTLMGDGANIPWRLLLIEILVEDPETGDGKSLVHSLQVNYLHRLIQMRIMDSKKPLHDLYNCLHSFCQSLQLEVLHSQTQQLMRQRLGDHIHIEEYKAGEHLVISYWRDLMRKENKSYASTTFKLSVHMDTNDPSRPLQITHFPLIHGTESLKVAQAIKSDYLSIERLLVHTIHVRSLTKLKVGPLP